MKKRITAILICLAMLFICGCKDTAQTKVKKPVQGESKTQTVIAMNPAVVSEDGTIKSARKTFSDSIGNDYRNGSVTFYDNTNWQWLYADTEDSYMRRSIRGIESYKDGSGNTVKGMSYVYSVTDDRASSLTVYDTGKMKISEYSGDTLAPSGILMTFTGGEKEVFAYTADSDCTLTLCDTENGTVPLVKGVADNNTDILNSDKPVGVVLGVSLNGRLLWQEILGNGALLGTQVSSVAFPSLSNLSLSAGDSILITAQTVDSADGLETGYFDIPGGTSVVNRNIKIGHEVEVKNETDALKGLSFINENGESRYTVITAASTKADVSAVANDLRNQIQEKIGTDVMYARDNSEIDYPCKILVGDTSFAESTVAKNEIIKGQKHNAADFIIRAAGNNVVINALNAVSLQTAVDYFVDNYCKDSKSIVPENLNYVSSKYYKVKTPTVAGNDLSKYKIIYSHTASYIERQGVDYLQREIIKNTGCNLDIANDKTAAAPYEIVVGTTHRTSSDYNVKSTTTDTNAYTIKVSGNKVFIAGDQTHATDAAIHKFLELIKTVSAFANGYSYSGKYDGGYSLTNGYKLVWSDEFNGNKLEAPWTTIMDISPTASGNGHIRTAQECATVEGGNLVQRFFTNNGGKNYYGSSVKTNGKDAVSWRYGYCEIRVKYPVQKGVTVAFCCFGAGTDMKLGKYQEIDIVENFGNPAQLARTIHGWGPWDGYHGQWGVGDSFNYKDGTEELEPFGYEYHTIGMEWERDYLMFTLDGVQVGYFDCSNPQFEYFQTPLHALVSVCTDYNRADELGKDFYEAFSYTDYFRIYQKADNDSIINRPKY